MISDKTTEEVGKVLLNRLGLEKARELVAEFRIVLGNNSFTQSIDRVYSWLRNQK